MNTKLVNNNLSPLPFYDGLEWQNHRKDYAFGHIYGLVTYRNMLMPFQVVLSGGETIQYARLYNAAGKAYTDITSSLTARGLKIEAKTKYSVLSYPGDFPVPEITQEGQFYLVIKIADLGCIYSDIFTVSNNVDGLLLLKYSNPYNFELKDGIVDFSGGFEFRCYLDTQIGKPEYSFEEEATERMGYSFIESQVSKKVYKFTFLAPEYLCDALRIVRLCQNKSVTSKGLTYDMTTFSMDVEWQDQGDLAAVECEFETDTVIANIGGYVPVVTDGDFSSDFNNDFRIG